MFSAVGGFRSQPPGDINLTQAYLFPAQEIYPGGDPVSSVTCQIGAHGFNFTTGYDNFIQLPYEYPIPGSTLPVGQDTAFSTSFDAAALTLSYGSSTSTVASPFVKVYGWNQDGFRTKYSDPGTAPSSNGRGITFDLTDDHIIVGQQGSPYINAWEWNSTTGFGTKLSDPSTALPNSNSVLQFNKSGNAIAVGHASSPFISVYAWSAGFGTKYSNASSLIGGISNNISFRTTDDTIAIAHNLPIIGTITGLSVYQWNNTTGFGTRYSSYPGYSDDYTHRGVDFNPTGDAITFTRNGVSESLMTWTWSSGFGTKYSALSSVYTIDSARIKFSQNNNAILTGFYTIEWNTSTGYGTEYEAAVKDPVITGSTGLFAANF